VDIRTRLTAHRMAIVAAALAVPLAMSAETAAAATAPAQPGMTAPAQPGPAMSAQPGITTAPVVSTGPQGQAPLPDEIVPATDFAPTRPVSRTQYAAPLRVNRLHAPQAVPPVARIVPPPSEVRVGNFVAPAPAWLPRGPLDAINTTSAGYESQISQYARSIGVPPSRADRIAAATVADTVAGGMVGAAVAGVSAVTFIGPFFWPVLIPGSILLGAAVGVGTGALTP
jgi:hypothetical protein